MRNSSQIELNWIGWSMNIFATTLLNFGISNRQWFGSLHHYGLHYYHSSRFTESLCFCHHSKCQIFDPKLFVANYIWQILQEVLFKSNPKIILTINGGHGRDTNNSRMELNWLLIQWFHIFIIFILLRILCIRLLAIVRFSLSGLILIIAFVCGLHLEQAHRTMPISMRPDASKRAARGFLSHV